MVVHHKVHKDHKGSFHDNMKVFVLFVFFVFLFVVANLIKIDSEQKTDDIR